MAGRKGLQQIVVHDTWTEPVIVHGGHFFVVYIENLSLADALVTLQRRDVPFGNAFPDLGWVDVGQWTGTTDAQEHGYSTIGYEYRLGVKEDGYTVAGAIQVRLVEGAKA